MRPEYTVHVADGAYSIAITVPCDDWTHAQAHQLGERMLTAAQDTYDMWRKAAAMAELTLIDEHTMRLTMPTLDLALLRTLAECTDRTALRNIRRLWGVELPTARLLLKAAREGVEQT